MVEHDTSSKAIEYYHQNAKDFYRYEQFAFKDIYSCFLPYIPFQGKALDVGAGTGRDAAAFFQRGLKVTAVEPADNLREYAISHHASENITWINDRLPLLEKLKGQENSFQVILCSNVLMHIDREQTGPALARLQELTATQGIILIALRTGPLDSQRHMLNIDRDDIFKHMKKLELLVEDMTADLSGRPDVGFLKLAFRK